MATSFDVVTNPDKPTIVKDPNAVLDYSWDWSAWLDDAGDVITEAEFTTTEGLVVDSSNIDPAGIVTAFVSGGTVGTKGSVTCRITTLGGRVEDRTLYFKIKER